MSSHKPVPCAEEGFNHVLLQAHNKTSALGHLHFRRVDRWYVLFSSAVFQKCLFAFVFVEFSLHQPMSSILADFISSPNDVVTKVLREIISALVKLQPTHERRISYVERAELAMNN